VFQFGLLINFAAKAVFSVPIALVINKIICSTHANSDCCENCLTEKIDRLISFSILGGHDEMVKIINSEEYVYKTVYPTSSV